MKTLEEAILLAMLNEDEAEAERLTAEMLPGELAAFSRVLDQTRRVVERRRVLSR